MKKKILVSHPISKKRLDALNYFFHVDCVHSITNKYDEVFVKIGEYDALLAISMKVDKALIDNGLRLKVISNYGVGYDNIDIGYASEKGITVANTPVATSKATAEYTMGLILSLLRKIALNDRLIRTGALTEWTGNKQMGNSLNGKLLGVLGMGRIGKELALMARSFGMKVIYYSRTKLSGQLESEYHIEYTSVENLFASADILSVHVPMNPETHHIVNQIVLDKMKSTSWIINTARGNVIDHDALIECLQNHKIKGAALDVFPDEPRIPDELMKMDNVLLSPHNGTGTYEDRQAMFAESFGNIKAFFEGKEMTGRVV